MIKMLRDSHNDAGEVEFKAGEIVCATVEEEDVLVRRGFADWTEVPEAELDAPDLNNAAVEGADE